MDYEIPISMFYVLLLHQSYVHDYRRNSLHYILNVQYYQVHFEESSLNCSTTVVEYLQNITPWNAYITSKNAKTKAQSHKKELHTDRI